MIFFAKKMKNIGIQNFNVQVLFQYSQNYKYCEIKYIQVRRCLREFALTIVSYGIFDNDYCFIETVIG